MTGFFRKLRASGAPAVLLTVLAVAALAALAELALTAAAVGREAEYRRAQYAAGDFYSWEMEDRGDGQYYMLANNSYFKIDGMGGRPVRAVEVFLSRESGDATETVLYYSGVKDGVAGEFPAAMTMEADGLYAAAIEAQSVDAIRIHPTEKVRTTVSFGGMVVNPPAEGSAYSAARVILWGFIFAAIYVLYNITLGRIDGARARKGLKACPLPRVSVSGWAAAYVLAGAAVMAVAFQASRMFTGAGRAASLLLPAVFAVYSLIFWTIWAIARRINSAEARLATAALAAGLLFVFASAPMQAPDEPSHYLRAYALSRGQLGFYHEYRYPDDVYRMIGAFPGEFGNNVIDTGRGSALTEMEKYLSGAGAAYSGRAYKSSVQLVIPYIPAALGMAVARLLGGGALACLYAARICNLLVYAACVWFAARSAARCRGALTAALLLPLTLFMAASVSYDSMLLSAAAVFFGLVLKGRLGGRELAALAASFAVIISIKPLYAPMVFLILLIPKDAVGIKLPRWACVAATAAAAAALYLGTLIYAARFGDVPRVERLPGVDAAAQLQYILSNPLRYIMVMAVDAYTHVFYLGDFGLFGWLDAPAPLTGFLAPVVIVAVAALWADDARGKNDKWIHLAVAALSYIAVVTGFYLVESSLGSTDILGVQARYFIPIVPCAVALLSNVLSPVLSLRQNIKGGEEARERISLYICGCAACIGAAELARFYFLT